ncbi:MAG: type II toxin-antitoxin system RelE/ParE family toxin [Robiginitomaculum sp.]|nr:type II toxin-antitoxin system RelE/ParE family toxin [Robiginitomaculum sp.]
MKETAWIKAAHKEFYKFPPKVQARMLDALAIASFGSKADIAKSMKGLGSGIFEIALPYQRDAFRVIYAVQIGDVLWVVHAFKKKSKRGIATPKQDIDLIKTRLKRIKEEEL